MDGPDAEENRPSSPPLAQEASPSAAGVVVSSVTPSAAGGPSALPLATGMDGVVGSPVTPAAVRAAPMLSAQADFINKLARRAVGLLPIPRTNKRKGRSRLPGEASRQSRRLAGKKVEFGPEDLERRMKKKAMQSLDILDEHEGIDQQAMDDYARLFGQPLSDPHVQALAALFNWSLPEELGPGNEEIVAA